MSYVIKADDFGISCRIEYCRIYLLLSIYYGYSRKSQVYKGKCSPAGLHIKEGPDWQLQTRVINKEKRVTVGAK